MKVRQGFTVIELLVVIAIIGVLVGLLLPATRSSHGAAQRMMCSNNLKQIGLAMHDYHAAYDKLPSVMGGTGRGATDRQGNWNRLSGMVGLLPFIEQQRLWDQISKPSEIDGVKYPAMGPAPWVHQYKPWATQIAVLRCPSDPQTRRELGSTNYVFCIGDVSQTIHRPQHQRGMFMCRKATGFSDVIDGLSNTIAMCETVTRVDRESNSNFAINQPSSMLTDPGACRYLLDPKQPTVFKSTVPLNPEGRGARWSDGSAGFSLFATLLPPNHPSCAVGGNEAVDGIYSGGSRHNGGMHVLMGDGAVKFITDSIDCGDLHQAPVSPEPLESGNSPSPYGLWGRLGTANGMEMVNTKDIF